MTDNQTIIVVGSTEKDGYGNLWVTPKGDGERIKIAGKREHLHPLFQQGQAISLKWETYMNKPYVADATPVSGQLPPAQEPSKILPAHQDEINYARKTAQGEKPQTKRNFVDAPRSMLLSYVKDIKCALIASGVKKEFTMGDALGMCAVAETWEKWCNGELDVEAEYKRYKASITKDTKES